MSVAVIALVGLLTAALEAGQPQTPSAAPGTTQAAPPPPASETYAYEPNGRRDPFVKLLGSGVDTREPGKRAEGPAGMMVSEISVRGVMQSRGALVAMILGPDNKTYIVHSGDKLFDGTIKAITQQGLVITQDVIDPLSTVKQREVRKLLRSLEEGRQ